MHNVFVYGTLKRGFANHRYLQEYTPTPATAYGVSIHASERSPYPYAMISENDIVHGELYSVNDETLRELDWLEGVPKHYIRIQIPVLANNGSDYQAWIYLAPKFAQRYPRLTNNEWTKH